MKAILFFVLPAALLLTLSGCTAGKPEAPKESKETKEAAAPTKAAAAKDDPEAKIKENIAKLPKEDQAAAEAQKFCAVEKDNPLGEMGTPYKLTIDGQTVYLCCKGCEKDALKNTEQTLATVKKLKEKNKGSASK